MCTRVGTRPCPVCRSLGWRPPQRGKRRPRPPTHGQLPSLLLKPKNLKKSGPGFIRGRVERAGPKRSRRSAAVTPLRQSWDLFLTFWNLFLTFYVRSIRKPVTPPSKTAQDVGTPDGPHCGRGTGAVGPAGPSLQTPTLPRLSPRRSGRKDAPGCRPRRPPLLLRLRGTASSFVPPGPGGPGPGLSSRPSCPLLPRLLQAKRPRRRFSHVPHRVPPRRPLQGLAPPAHAALRRLLGYLLLLRVRSNVTFRANILHTPKPSGNPCHWGKWGDVFPELKTGFHWRWGNYGPEARSGGDATG